MSSMVGGALGVAVLTAFARGLSERHTRDAVQKAGLTQDQIDQAHRALVNSSSFQDALNALPDNLQRSVTAAAKTAFSEGVADAFLITGIVSLVATAIVIFVWPRRHRVAEIEGDSRVG